MTNFKETFSFEGVWWLPENIDDKFPGALHYHFQEGLRLELKGVFKPFFNKDPRTLNSPVILGESDHGEKITLYGCSLTEAKTPVVHHPKEQRLPSSSTISCQIAFTGYQFRSTEDMKFKKIFVNFSRMDEWLGISGLGVTPTYDKEKEAPKILIEYIQPKPIIVNLNEFFTITIDFSYDLPKGYNNPIEATILQSVNVCLETNVERKISDFFEVISQLERFLSLGIMKPVYAYNFMGISANPDDEEKFHFPKSIFLTLSENFEMGKKVDQQEMLFSYADIKDRFELLLQNWFKSREALQPVFDLYFHSVHNRNMPDYLEFLNYIQAIESFHRRTRNNKIRPKSVFRKLRDEILAKLDEEQKKMIGQRLDHANEPSLNDRLNEIFKEYYEFRHFFSITTDQFIRDVVNTRNFHTHYDKKLKKKALTGANLDYTTRKLRAILQLIFLLELGFDRDRINRFAGKINRWQLDIVYTSFKI